MKLILLGSPGSGKGTQANLLKTKYACIHISTGDILRRHLKEKSALGFEAQKFMSKGELVPDGLVVEMVRKRLCEEDVAAGFFMDGFPRTLPQVTAFDVMLEELGWALDAVLFFSIDEETLVWRLTHRRSCSSCGKILSLQMVDATEATLCPECGGKLYHRDDDSESVIRNRLAVYREQTAPLVSCYEKKGLLHIIDASGSPEETFQKVQAALAG